jgi:hypothetical protein
LLSDKSSNLHEITNNKTLASYTFLHQQDTLSAPELIVPIYYANLIFFVNILEDGRKRREGEIMSIFCGLSVRKTIYENAIIIASHGLQGSVIKIIITPETGKTVGDHVKTTESFSLHQNVLRQLFC